MIRHFDKEHDFFKPGYAPPSRQKKIHESKLLDEKTLECYKVALQDMPQLMHGSVGKKNRQGIVKALNRPALPTSHFQKLKQELKEKDHQLESLMLARGMNEVEVRSVVQED